MYVNVMSVVIVVGVCVRVEVCGVMSVVVVVGVRAFIRVEVCGVMSVVVVGVRACVVCMAQGPKLSLSRASAC